MERAIAVAHALADETRWRIAALMTDEALCVCELADVLEMAQSTVSSHLQVMRKGGLVTVEKEEKWAYYQLSKEVLPVWNALRAIEGGKSDRTLERDRKKAIARLALRGRSECKGPRRSIPPLRPAPQLRAGMRKVQPV
jgi:ArsR family transcriptional regulator